MKTRYIHKVGVEGANPTHNRLLVGDALAHLRAEHRAVISRSYYQGLTTAQIAAELGVTESVVKSRLHHALHALRESLQTPTATEAQGTWSLSISDTA